MIVSRQPRVERVICAGIFTHDSLLVSVVKRPPIEVPWVSCILLIYKKSSRLFLVVLTPYTNQFSTPRAPDGQMARNRLLFAFIMS